MDSRSPVTPDSTIGDLQLEELERTARASNGGQPLPLREWVALAEAWRIAPALREALGIGRRTLYSKMEKLGLTPVWLVPGNGAPAPPTVEPRLEGNGSAA